jgi:hypothetical protein
MAFASGALPLRVAGLPSPEDALVVGEIARVAGFLAWLQARAPAAR